jgi:ABC-type phosphate transport system permease subunit
MNSLAELIRSTIVISLISLLVGSCWPLTIRLAFFLSHRIALAKAEMLSYLPNTLLRNTFSSMVRTPFKPADPE